MDILQVVLQRIRKNSAHVYLKQVVVVVQEFLDFHECLDNLLLNLFFTVIYDIAVIHMPFKVTERVRLQHFLLSFNITKLLFLAELAVVSTNMSQG